MKGNSDNLSRFCLYQRFISLYTCALLSRPLGVTGSAMVLGKSSVPGRPTIRMIVGQGPIALAIGAG